MTEDIGIVRDIQFTLTSISRVINNLSIRVAQDSDADDFKKSQFVYAMNGGSSGKIKFDQPQTTSDTNNEELKIKCPNPNCTKSYPLYESRCPHCDERNKNDLLNIKQELASDFLPGENHLSIISATEVGCHHPEISFSTDFSAMALHHNDSLCTRCTHLFRVDLLKGEFSPFRCWRRGHRSGRFGFLYGFSLAQKRNKWVISKDSSHNCILSSNLVTSSLQYYLSREQNRVGDYTNFGKLSRNLSSLMMVVINIIDDVVAEIDEHNQVSSLLPSQMLVSSQFEPQSIIKQRADQSRLPDLVSHLIESIHGKWMNNSMSKQSNGILSIAIIKNGYDELVKSIEAPIREKSIVESGNFSIIESEIMSSSVLSEINSNLITSEGVSICLILDPIMDLEVTKLV